MVVPRGLDGMGWSVYGCKRDLMGFYGSDFDMLCCSMTKGSYSKATTIHYDEPPREALSKKHKRCPNEGGREPVRPQGEAMRGARAHSRCCHGTMGGSMLRRHEGTRMREP